MDFEVLKKRCKEKGYSPSGLLAKLGISKSNVTSWKNGANPSCDTLIKLSEELECSAGYLLGVEDSSGCSGISVCPELRNKKATSARTISLKCYKELSDTYLYEIASYADCSIMFLCGDDNNYQHSGRKGNITISERGKDKLLSIFDDVNNNMIMANIQMQLSRIILHNLQITKANQISDERLSNKAEYILTGKVSEDSLSNYPFNLSDLLLLGDMFDKSIHFMISGIE